MSEVFVPHTKLRNLSEPKPKLNILSQPNINLNLMFCQNPTPTEAKIKISINPYKYGPKILVESTAKKSAGYFYELLGSQTTHRNELVLFGIVRARPIHRVLEY